jgi:hypothetical protein
VRGANLPASSRSGSSPAAINAALSASSWAVTTPPPCGWCKCTRLLLGFADRQLDVAHGEDEWGRLDVDHEVIGHVIAP